MGVWRWIRSNKMNLYKIVMLVCVIMFVGCNNTKPEPKQDESQLCKQELSKATDWVRSWRTCSGDGAIKKDGSLWQFGKVGGCNWGQIVPIDSSTGKPIYKKKTIYHLKPKKIGDGFDGAKIINGGYRVYGIKKDGTLWGWGEGLREKPMLLSHSHDWVDFGLKWEGNGCCSHDVGLQKDGSLWRFTETLNFVKKSPIGHLKRVGNQKWDKVILYCCAMYALKKDGSIWINRGLNATVKFKKIDFSSDCFEGDPNFCKGLKKRFFQMPSQSINNYEKQSGLEVNVGIGTLCVMPKVTYK